MKKLVITFDSGLQITYNILQSKTAKRWSELLEKAKYEHLLQTHLNHRHGFSNDLEITDVFEKMISLNIIKNSAVEPVNLNNWHVVLNSLHEKFLGFHKNTKDTLSKEESMKLNLSIHWLEYELENKFNESNQFIFNLDFNHHWRTYALTTKIFNDEYENFSPELKFGTLHIHYTEIGRHFLEMVVAEDTGGDKEDFKPQSTFNATCGFVFSEPQDKETLETKLKKFYDDKGGESFFNLSFDDPLLAKGFFQVGTIENIHIYQEHKKREELRQAIKTSSIVNWKLY